MTVVRPLRFHALHAAAAGVEVAHERAGELVGGFDLYFHDGLEQAGLGLLHGFAEGQTAGHLERHFVRVDVVIAAVVDGDFEVDHRIAGEITARRRLHDALFDRGYELARNGAAEDLVGELEAAAARQRLHPDLAVAELAVAAALLLVASVGFGLARVWTRDREPWAP